MIILQSLSSKAITSQSEHALQQWHAPTKKKKIAIGGTKVLRAYNFICLSVEM